MRSFFKLFAIALLAPLPMVHAQEGASGAVKVIAPRIMQVNTAKGSGAVPIYLSRDWTKPQPDITRALIIFHGRARNADVYNASGEKAIATAGDKGKTTILITPQFLQQEDIDAFHLPPAVLRWGAEQWMGGSDAVAPAPISSFTVIDAILGQLANRTIFPNLKQVVLAGHSGGGQVMQRYAVVGKGESALTHAGVHVRYVVANPSSYVYFSPERPDADGKFGPFNAASCRKYDNWKYGIHDVPAYVEGANFTALEDTYARRDVIYLLGGADTDPNHPVLDKTCGGEAEGAYRLARGTFYFHYMQSRHPKDLTQRAWEVPGVGHDGDKMFNSSCGLSALFDIGACTTPIP